MAEPTPRSRRAFLLKLGVVAAVLLVAAGLVVRGVDLRGLVNRALDLVRDAGPLAFFTAWAILPAFGAPLLAFALTVGPAFGERLGMPLVILCSLLAVGANMALSYALARRGLRPLVEWLMQRLGYKLPQVDQGDATDLIVLLRVTPGLPFPATNYLLGLAGVPFGRYIVISCAIAWSFTTGFILFGDALLQGRGKVAFLALCLLMALSAATHLVRKHYGKKARPAP